MINKYDVYIHNELKASFYNNPDTREYVSQLINDEEYHWESISVIKNGQALTIEVLHQVTIGGY